MSGGFGEMAASTPLPVIQSPLLVPAFGTHRMRPLSPHSTTFSHALFENPSLDCVFLWDGPLWRKFLPQMRFLVELPCLGLPLGSLALDPASSYALARLRTHRRTPIAVTSPPLVATFVIGLPSISVFALLSGNRQNRQSALNGVP